MDMQEAVVGERHDAFFRYDSELLTKVNSVISETDAETVVYIRNLMKNSFLSQFAPVKIFDGMPEAELAKNLLQVSPNVFSKYKGDAFSNQEFRLFLKSSQIDTVELIGADGGGCVSLTALGACKNGYKVIINTEAIGTMYIQKRDQYYEKLKKLGAVFI